MWYLISLENPDSKYSLLTGKTYTIGRKDCDIIVEGDAAISRKHAEIVLDHPEAYLHRPDKLPTVTLTDLSKFGTSVNNDKLEKNQGKQLKDGDELLLGTRSTFTIVYEPFIITSSCLDNQSKKNVRSLIQTLGGHVINDWKKDCSLLLMQSISVTVKVICALVSQKYIVTPAYLQAYTDHLQGKGDKPDSQKFQPEVTETQIDPSKVTFGPEKRRQSLLQGMKFIFLNPKQFKRMSLAIELAGGLPVLMDEGSGNDDLALVEEGSVVMNSDPMDSTQGFSQQNIQWIKYVAKYLKKHNRRMILDPELGYAVLYCDTHRYCNPDIEMAYSQALPKIPAPSLSQVDILAQNTEHVLRSPVIRGRNEPDAVNETHTEIKSNHKSTRSFATESMATRVKEEPPSQRNASEPGTPSKKISKRGREAEVESTPVGKKVKQEKITPAKTVETPLRRSPRRSPSPARQSSDKVKEGSNRKSVNKPRTGKVIVEESDEELSNRNKTNTKDVKTLEENADLVLRSKDALAENDDLSDLFEVGSPSRKAAPKTKRKKGQLSESEEEGVPENKRGRRNIVSLDSDEENRIKRRKKEEVEREDADSDNEDMFEVKTSSSKRKHTEVVVEPDRTGGNDVERMSEAGDNRLGPNNSELSPAKRTSQQSGAVSVKREKRDQSHNSSDATEPGFINTLGPAENNVKKELTHTKEEDQPSNCFVVKFVSLVARQPKPRAHNTDDTPEGYVKWRGKLVKNFKKFKKSNHVGAGSLPRIIGGSDLEPHVASRSKEIEEWFREEERALSQKSENERQADELFEFEVRRPVSVKRR